MGRRPSSSSLALGPLESTRTGRSTNYNSWCRVLENRIFGRTRSAIRSRVSSRSRSVLRHVSSGMRIVNDNHRDSVAARRSPADRAMTNNNARKIAADLEGDRATVTCSVCHQFPPSAPRLHAPFAINFPLLARADERSFSQILAQRPHPGRDQTPGRLLDSITGFLHVGYCRPHASEPLNLGNSAR
jgi:hypothetical protein